MEKTKDLKQLYGNSEIKYAVAAVLRHLAAAGCSFLCASASFDGLAPFGVAAVSSIFPEYIPMSVIGAAIGYCRIYGVTVLTLRYIAAAAVAGIISYFFKRSSKRRYHKYFSAVSGFFPIFVSGLIISLSVTLSADEIVLYAAEGAVCALCAWFGDCFMNINPRKRYASRLTGTETAATLVIMGVLLLALESFHIFIFSPAVIIGAYIILVLASFGGEKYGALAGICAGVVIGLSEKGGGFVTGGLALGGLLVGIFGRRKRFISALILIMTVSVTAFASDDWLTASYILYDVGIAALMFILTPPIINKQYGKIFALSDDGAFLNGQRGVLGSRLNTFSDGIDTVSQSLKAIGGIYRRRSMPSEKQITENVQNKICSKCENADLCLKQDGDAVKKWFRDIETAVKRSNSPDEREMPKQFFARCIHSDEVIKSIGLELECYRSALRECAVTGETVNIVSDQFCSVADMLKSFADSLQNGEEYDASSTELVRSVLEKDLELTVISCGVFRNENGFLYCEISFPPRKNYNFADIAKSVHDILGKHFEKPVINRLTDNTINFTICEKTKYKVETGNFQINSHGGKWCGDTFDTFFDGKGRFTIVLSDGMGTGQKAAADSVVCCSLASTLLRSGYPADCILKMINAAMIVRSGEESLATLDIAVIDLYSGEVVFYKAGAGFSAVMKHMKMLKIDKPSLPIGILRDVGFEKIELTVHDGDSIVLMSDGVAPETLSSWKNTLHDAQAYEGNELADKLARAAKLNADKDSEDDITVVTAVLSLNE